MHINLQNLEAINELPNKGATMLTSNQIRRLQVTDRWLREIRASEEFRQLEYSPDVTLGDAIQAVGELLDEHDHCDYKPSNFTNDQWYSYLEQKPVMHIPRVVTLREKINSFILDAASEIAILSLLTTGFMVVGTIFCHGIDRLEESRGDQYQPTWIYNAKIFEGSAIASIAVFLGASLTGACAAGDKNDD
ncbi:hypothetical protein VF14_21725 [Nostoc linckia z18]|uniref:Uncharacterized protein n=2 Tax=Nostoc linckia TaxID=92942 RepID=A0A9Q5ZA53_NOSLI|nr:hypothetical protein [Nostoc linckia]PHK40484.1 hypothetical protein VF12_10295 [Nostoc linckia z15]PHK44373.1 hypothetical protein VF13_22140 [Nostoc linckia z16]PHJ57176.1 hypothetical protein VF02_31065 [Nostoc linckia z1]PHJ59652.1 hypothetical protein VF05_31820 [Nostoc linckia z3]PHJ63952.1 hypothetical protein VF03_29670 [Nostoc linckia z2]